MMRRWRQVPSGRGSGRVGAAWRGTGAASPWMRAALGLRIFLRPLLETLSFASRRCVTYKKNASRICLRPVGDSLMKWKWGMSSSGKKKMQF